MESNICSTCNQPVPVQKKPRGRPKIVEDYKERKKEYNKRYYEKVKMKNTSDNIPDEST